MAGITATIITLNEQNNIRECILSAQQVCDEIIVVDSLSNDDVCCTRASSAAGVSMISPLRMCNVPCATQHERS